MQVRVRGYCNDVWMDKQLVAGGPNLEHLGSLDYPSCFAQRILAEV